MGMEYAPQFWNPSPCVFSERGALTQRSAERRVFHAFFHNTKMRETGHGVCTAVQAYIDMRAKRQQQERI